MPRPKTRRLIDNPPLFDSFKPSGTRARDLQDLRMSLDELEALRLADLEGLNQDEAASRMDISRSTFSRLVESARRKSAEFFLEGRRLVIGGGPVHFKANRMRCGECGRVFPAALGNGPEICPHCGSKVLSDLAGGYGHGDCCAEDEHANPRQVGGRRRGGH